MEELHEVICLFPWLYQAVSQIRRALNCGDWGNGPGQWQSSTGVTGRKTIRSSVSSAFRNQGYSTQPWESWWGGFFRVLACFCSENRKELSGCAGNVLEQSECWIGGSTQITAALCAVVDGAAGRLSGLFTWGMVVFQAQTVNFSEICDKINSAWSWMGPWSGSP